MVSCLYDENGNFAQLIIEHVVTANGMKTCRENVSLIDLGFRTTVTSVDDPREVARVINNICSPKSVCSFEQQTYVQTAACIVVVVFLFVRHRRRVIVWSIRFVDCVFSARFPKLLYDNRSRRDVKSPPYVPAPPYPKRRYGFGPGTFDSGTRANTYSVLLLLSSGRGPLVFHTLNSSSRLTLPSTVLWHIQCPVGTTVSLPCAVTATY